MPTDLKRDWETYCKESCTVLAPLLDGHGFILDEVQPHIGGERYLMRAVTTESGRKLVLLGKEKATGRPVVIKTASDATGIEELQSERNRRHMLSQLRFAYQAFLVPEELFFTLQGGRAISVQALIPQERSFIQRPLKEQFAIALRSFKAQEGSHATTAGHIRQVVRTFGRMTASDYLEKFNDFTTGVAELQPDNAALHKTLGETAHILRDNAETIAQYGDFLTHTDFVPHNFRVSGDALYLLDLSSIRFGNKYEGWARFANFMALYEPELRAACLSYVKDNRAPEEQASFRLMRLYRLGEIIWYYANTLPQSAGDLLELNSARLSWWHHVLEQELRNEPPAESRRMEYTTLRDRLRSPDEKLRQKDLH